MTTSLASTSSRGRTVLVADDDPRLLNLLKWTLEMGEYRVVAAPDGSSALESARENAPDLFVLDVSMPDIDGFEVVRRLREDNVISPIMMLTGRIEEEDKVAGLEAGADDYQTKPFGRRELLARVNALLRRTQTYEREPGNDAVETGDLRIDFDQRLVFKHGKPVDLTPTEFHILANLAREIGQVVRGPALLQKVWGPTYTDEIHLLRVNVARMRRKIEDTPSKPRYVRTHSRQGYSLAQI
jgi:DNA-binding response OmpR family regulator